MVVLITEWATALMARLGYPGLLLLMALESMVAPVPSEAVMPFAGFLIVLAIDTMVKAGADPDLLFALAELSFLHGQAARKPEYALAAAVYAYAFLFPEGHGQAPGRFDPRLRTAADLYN